MNDHTYLGPTWFIPDVGNVACCSCGWRSDGAPTPLMAQGDFLHHAANAEVALLAEEDV